ncbi:hypothetical protein CVV68_22045 [Arthrobacter livingstonensis]|uniref:Uncharacterized protein n=1 Tax=Arthrobacter livingstonensis TaxID=670078 RepID=A0A2V5KZY7_9MICC|nr:hypothetical protein CVV68_22045 [Arthrobacter livingstonensis]
MQDISDITREPATMPALTTTHPAQLAAHDEDAGAGFDNVIGVRLKLTGLGHAVDLVIRPV